ncbi:hypothetical protein GCM10027280_05170 [Micromonospora polyrhachis]|uniref:Uncharacterized protein n=1 Tax=Micromonospora polyrhachis TaxID=1282883 RepID=A0A7W7SKP7_9ACTN|nr:hypothetical protein [Micromonospora polyrhachis]
MWGMLPSGERAETREQADRLTLISRWGHFVLDRPVFVQLGETIRTLDGYLLVERNNGQVAAYPGYVNR